MMSLLITIALSVGDPLTHPQDRRTMDNTWTSTTVDGWIYKARAKISRNGQKSINLLVYDRDGRVAAKALETLVNDGYDRVVGVKGGFKTLTSSDKWAAHIGRDQVKVGVSLSLSL